nr:helix-turn-helix domain-containing protein [uncultured Flavobacterium sp.]
MIKDLININFKDLALNGMDIHVIKKYVVTTNPNDCFETINLSILLIKSGKFKIRLKEITKNLNKYDLLIIPKNSFCTLLEVKDKMQLFLISFTAEFALENCLKKELIDSFNFLISKSSVVIKLEEKDFLVLSLIFKLMHFVNKDFKQDGKENELQRISFNLFLFELRLIYTKYQSETVIPFNRRDRITIQFLTIVTIHCKKHHNISFYASALFVTSGYLNKVVKQVTGSTVKIIIVQAIITEAKSLLEDTQLTISFIADEMEFDSIFSFSAFFKRHTSISPSEYRLQTIDKFKNR